MNYYAPLIVLRPLSMSALCASESPLAVPDTEVNVRRRRYRPGPQRPPRRAGRWYAIALALCTGFSSASEPGLEEEVISARPGAELDWMPITELPEALQDRRCRLCAGRYIDPQSRSRALAPQRAPIEASARQTELEGDTLRLSGTVEVTQGYRKFSSDEASINRESRAATLAGNIELREPGVLIRGERGEFYSRSGAAQLENSHFVLHEQHLRGRAGLLSRDADKLIRIEEGAMTFCAPGDKDWLLGAGQLELDLEQGVGVARDATLRVEGYPVFYAPWMRFPLDARRQTGLLFPILGSDSRGGPDISVPLYLNLAPNYDLLYTPRYIAQRGFNHEFQGRYLDPHNGTWNLGGSFIAGDKRFARDFPETDADRWLASLRHRGVYAGRWRSRIDYTRVSDINLIRDLETSRLDVRRDVNLLQLGQLDYLGQRWLVNVQAQQFQSLAGDIRPDFRKLPQITARYRGLGKPFALHPIGLVQYSNFGADEKDRVTGQRLYAHAGASYPMNWSYGYIKPTAKYRLLKYRLNRHMARRDDRPGARSALLSIDSGLFFERRATLAQRRVVQTLEPRAFYLYSRFDEQSAQPDFDSAELTFNYNQLFRDTRFSGRDRLDDANQMAIGITTRILDERNGEERFNASIGQIVYFTNRRVRLKATDPELDQSSSELAGELNFYPNKRLSLRSNLQYDPSANRMNAANLLASYIRGNESVFNLGYTFRRPLALVGNPPVTKQVNFSTYLPISRNWRFFMAWNYSLQAERSVEEMLGIEYDSCCWRVRLLHLRYFDTAGERAPNFDTPNLDREFATQLQIVLKGLGGFGSRVEQLMQDMIRGFDRVAYVSR